MDGVIELALCILAAFVASTVTIILSLWARERGFRRRWLALVAFIALLDFGLGWILTQSLGIDVYWFSVSFFLLASILIGGAFGSRVGWLLRYFRDAL